MTQNRTRYLLLAFDEGFHGPGSVAVATALQHSDPDVGVIVGSVGLEEATIRDLKSLEGGDRVEVVEINDLVDVLPKHPRFPAASWARIFVDSIAPSHAERIVYLDGDTLSRLSLMELVDIDLKGRTIGACASRRYHTLAERDDSGWVRVGAHPSNAYFNAGVIVIDLKRWRDLDVSSRLLELAESDVALSTLPDQDALNLVLWDDWYPIPSSLWNYPGSLISRGSEFARVVHFYGLVKPWDVGVPAKHLQREYVAAAKAVGWEISVSPRRRVRRILRDLAPAGFLERKQPGIPPRETRTGKEDE